MQCQGPGALEDWRVELEDLIRRIARPDAEVAALVARGDVAAGRRHCRAGDRIRVLRVQHHVDLTVGRRLEVAKDDDVARLVKQLLASLVELERAAGAAGDWWEARVACARAIVLALLKHGAASESVMTATWRAQRCSVA